MTEFVAELRYYCRNPRCRSKFPQSVANPREAFCARGCHSSFYRKRCLVCEGPMARRREDQKVCRKSKCRNVFRGGFDGGRYHGPPSAKLSSKTPDFIGSKQPLRQDRPPLWRIVAAGASITANQYHCAIVGADEL
jgi:hypothetical protein